MKTLSTHKLKLSLAVHIKRTVKHSIGELKHKLLYTNYIAYQNVEDLSMFTTTMGSNRLTYNARVFNIFSDEYDMSREETLLYTKDYILKWLNLKGYEIC